MIKTTTVLSALAIGATLFATSAVHAGFTVTNNNGGIAPMVKKVASCLVTGAASEFPDDVLLINKGAITIKAGDKIAWKVPGYGQGTHTLVADLSAGQTVHLLHALNSPAPAGESCSAKVK